MLVAMVCYFGVCIALLFDLRGSAHERRQSATPTVSQEAREAATEWEAALARVSPQRAPTKSSERMASTFDAPTRPMSFKEPAPRQPMIRRLESARSMNTGKSSMHTLQAWMQSKSQPSLFLRATEDSASKSPRPRQESQRADARRGALPRNGSLTRPFVSSSARFYAEVVRRQQAALLRAGSQQRRGFMDNLIKS
jgi:hypothetical protein